MKTLSPRQRKILEILERQNDLSAREIENQLNISQATAYREIQAIIDLGYAVKIPGGLGLERTTSKQCLQCHHEVNLRTAFLLEQNNGEKKSACCAHCGLMALQHRPEIKTIMSTDFLYGTIFNATQAWYVLDSSVSPCCRPSVLSFARRQDADRFASAFGGHVANFERTYQKVNDMMRFPGENQ